MTRDSSVLGFTKLVFRLMPGIKKSFILLVFLTIIYETIKFIPPFLVKIIVDGVFEGALFNELYPYVIAIFATLIIMLIVEIHAITYIAKLAADYSSRLLRRLFQKLMQLPLAWHEKQNTGTLISKSSKAASYIDHLLWFINNDLLPSIIQLILTAGVLFWVDYRIGLLFLLFTPIYLKFIDNHFRNVQPLREKYHEDYDQSTNLMAQSLYNIQTVKDYGKEKYEFLNHSKTLDLFMEGIRTRANFEQKAIIKRDIIMHFVRSSTIGLALYLLYLGSLTPGDLVLVFTLNEKAFLNLYRLGRVYTFMGDMYEALYRADQIQNTTNELSDDGKKNSKNGDLILSNVDFCYNTQKVLKNLNIKFEKGKTTALIGHSGSGKTTLVKLLMRHYDTTNGSITLAGTNIKDIPLNQVRKRFAFVSQNTEIFDRTVARNIAYANPKASTQQIIAAAKKANAHEFIKDFDEGYETVVGENGIRLSGGQRQRLSIARALLAGADIIVFDEATSNLDSKSEKLIQEAIFRLKNKTLIIIAHRLSTIKNADRIIVLHKGKVMEEGTHRQLLKKAGIYHSMIKLQKLGELRQ